MFGAVRLTKIVISDKYNYSGYSIGFDRRGIFSVSGGFCRNFIIFGVNIIFCAY